MHIPIYRLTMRRRYMNTVLTQLVEEDVGPGKATRDLVSGLSACTGAAGGIAVSSTFTALVAAVDAIGIQPADRVVVPALAPAVYLDALRARGLVVVLADVDPETGSVSAETLAGHLADGARAVFVHHTLGAAMGYDAATEAGLPVIDDLSTRLSPAPEEATLAQNGAGLVLVSLEAGSLIRAGGGAVLLARKRSQIPTLKTAAHNASQHQQLGNMEAALAYAQLQDLGGDSARRQEIALLYRGAVRKTRHETLGGPQEDPAPPCAFVVKLKDSLAEVRQYARKYGVEARAAFEDTCVAVNPEAADLCPNARRLHLCCLLFPLYPMLTRRSAETVCRVLATLP
jgi:dTDP-4-amino-4,6-dideoxygalactose transaminase